MNPRSTLRWLVIAVLLAAAIFVHKKISTRPPTGPFPILPGFKPADVTSIQVFPKGRPAIHVERTNGGWRLNEPPYPAQVTSIEFLLEVLRHLGSNTRITAAEMKKMTNAEEQFGLDPPRASLIFGPKKVHVLIGDKTALGDQVYLQVVEGDGVFIVDAALLSFIPETASNWRESALADWSQLKFDRIAVTNGAKVLELQADLTNRSWRMIQPLPIRADSEKIGTSLQRLAGLRVKEFCSDDPKPDLESYGLANPDLTVGLFQGTNTALLLHFGKAATNGADLVFARRGEQNTIVTVARDSLQPWLAASSHEFRDFVDHHLVVLKQPPDLIEVQADDHFTLQRQTNGTWRVVEANLPADPARMQEILTHLVNLRFPEIENEIVFETDLPQYGLKPPARQYILKAADPADPTTNTVLAKLDFGTHDEKVYARRAGEDFVFAIDPRDLFGLPSAGWQVRDRQIWKFALADVASITVHQGGKTREMIRQGTNSWSLGPHSQGTINPFALEEAALQFSDLAAVRWLSRGNSTRADLGFKTDGLQVTLELKDGRKFSVEFGEPAASGMPRAETMVENEPWIFEFPPLLYYKFVQPYLRIPADQL